MPWKGNETWLWQTNRPDGDIQFRWTLGKVRKVRETLGSRVSRVVCHAYRYLEHEVQGNIGIVRKLQTFRLTNLPSLYTGNL